MRGGVEAGGPRHLPGLSVARPKNGIATKGGNLYIRLTTGHMVESTGRYGVRSHWVMCVL
jgi:hypothetical protein